MNVNWDILKKIPIFKNVDFEDRRSRVRVAMFFFGAALFVVVLLLMLIPPAPETKNPGRDERALLEVPQGRDNEEQLFSAEDMLAARDRLNPGNKDIFIESAPRYQGTFISFDDSQKEKEEATPAEDTSYHDALAEAFGLPAAEKDDGGQPRRLSREERRARAAELFGMGDDGGDEKVTPETATQKRSSRDEAEYDEPEPLRPAPKPAAKQKPVKKTPAQPREDPPQETLTAQATATETAPEAEPAPKQKFRRSGGISSVDEDWGTIEGLSSLDNDNEYIEEDVDHPYKVVFVRDQKLRSGDRVTLRLLEDLIVENVLVPKNTHIYGVCSIGDRLRIDVKTMEINGKFYTLSMSAYDADGGEGLYCPETASQEAAQQTRQQAASTASSVLSSAASIAGTAFGSPYLGSAIGGLTNTGARLISQKGGTTTVEVRSGYMFYLLKEEK